MVEFEHQGRGSKGWVIRDNAVHGTGQCCGVWWDTLGCFSSMAGQERVGVALLESSVAFRFGNQKEVLVESSWVNIAINHVISSYILLSEQKIGE